MNSSTAAIVVSKIVEKIQLIIGIGITFFFGAIAIWSTFDHEYDELYVVITFYIIFAIGILLIALSIKRHKLIKNFKTYVTILSEDPTGSIDNLATPLNVSVDKVRKDLQLMIDKKYFVNAYVDLETNRIIFPSSDVETSEKVKQNKTADEQYKAKDYISVTCKNCGGINKITKGQVGECEYCGSIIS